jgi:DNA mismatch repair protein MSH6
MYSSAIKRANPPNLGFRLCPVDAILTRMGAYDNMFSNSSTFKVELDEW